MKKIIIFLTIIGISSSNVFGIEEGRLELRKEFLQDQHEKTMLLAEQGDADAQYKLVFNYAGGRGVEADMDKAIFWLKKSAKSGNSDAQLDLGIKHYIGKTEGILKDDNKSIEWIKKSAEQENAKAQGRLSTEYALGEIVEKDMVLATYWLKKAANSGNSDAQYNLAYRYHDGDLVEPDPVKKVEWSTKSAEQGHLLAQNFLAVLYFSNNYNVQED